MPTFTLDVQNDQIILISAISIPNRSGPPRNRYNSLLDTGAQTTLISEKVANDIGLVAVGGRTIVGVDGKPLPTELYRVRLAIPVSSPRKSPEGEVLTDTYFSGREMDVSLLPYQPEDYDVVLGMNFLADFHMTLFAGNLIMSN